MTLGCLIALCVSAQPRMQVPEYWVGAHGGVSAGMVLFQPAVDGMHRGWATKTEAQGRVERNLHYIELPIFMHLNFGNETCRWIFNLGPQIGYCVWDESNAIDHRFDWGLAAGTGFYVRTKNAGAYELEIRYDFSFGGVFGTGVTDNFNMANPMDLSINLGWYWPIKKKVKIKN